MIRFAAAGGVGTKHAGSGPIRCWHTPVPLHVSFEQRLPSSAHGDPAGSSWQLESQQSPSAVLPSSQGPADAVADVVTVRLHLAGRRDVPGDVARRARRGGGVVAAEDPVAGFVERRAVAVRVERDAVLRLVVDLDLRVIRPHVTLAAVLRGADRRNSERAPWSTYRSFSDVRASIPSQRSYEGKKITSPARGFEV